jgi:hypothetical protein
MATLESAVKHSMDLLAVYFEMKMAKNIMPEMQTYKWFETATSAKKYASI